MFNKKRIKELEAKLAAYKELTDQYQDALEAREALIRQFHNWSSGVVPIRATYTITESDINRYNLSQFPHVAKDRLANAVTSAIKKNFDPIPVYDDSGEILCYEYDIEIRQRVPSDNPVLKGKTVDYEAIWKEI